MKLRKKRWGGQATYQKVEKCRKNIITNAERKRHPERGRRR
jgi:hypothetical protein